MLTQLPFSDLGLRKTEDRVGPQRLAGFERDQKRGREEMS